MTSDTSENDDEKDQIIKKFRDHENVEELYKDISEHELNVLHGLQDDPETCFRLLVDDDQKDKIIKKTRDLYLHENIEELSEEEIRAIDREFYGNYDPEIIDLWNKYRELWFHRNNVEYFSPVSDENFRALVKNFKIDQSK